VQRGILKILKELAQYDPRSEAHRQIFSIAISVDALSRQIREGDAGSRLVHRTTALPAVKSMLFGNGLAHEFSSSRANSLPLFA